MWKSSLPSLGSSASLGLSDGLPSRAETRSPSSKLSAPTEPKPRETMRSRPLQPKVKPSCAGSGGFRSWLGPELLILVSWLLLSLSMSGCYRTRYVHVPTQTTCIPPAKQNPAYPTNLPRRCPKDEPCWGVEQEKAIGLYATLARSLLTQIYSCQEKAKEAK